MRGALALRSVVSPPCVLSMRPPARRAAPTRPEPRTSDTLPPGRVAWRGIASSRLSSVPTRVAWHRRAPCTPSKPTLPIPPPATGADIFRPLAIVRGLLQKCVDLQKSVDLCKSPWTLQKSVEFAKVAGQRVCKSVWTQKGAPLVWGRVSARCHSPALLRRLVTACRCRRASSRCSPRPVRGTRSLCPRLAWESASRVDLASVGAENCDMPEGEP